jgi:hypothetical protein
VFRPGANPCDRRGAADGSTRPARPQPGTNRHQTRSAHWACSSPPPQRSGSPSPMSAARSWHGIRAHGIAGRGTAPRVGKTLWRRRAESNRRTGLCRPPSIQSLTRVSRETKRWRSDSNRRPRLCRPLPEPLGYATQLGFLSRANTLPLVWVPKWRRGHSFDSRPGIARSCWRCTPRVGDSGPSEGLDARRGCLHVKRLDPEGRSLWVRRLIQGINPEEVLGR